MVIHINDLKNEDTGVEGGLYTCRYWNSITKLCTAYDKRPMMCRDFPYGKQCMMDTNCNEPGNTRTTLKYEASLFY